jgi:hypothetical protein
MKKFIVTLLVSLCGAVSLFAGDAEDIKALFYRQYELFVAGDFAALEAALTPDFITIESHGVFNLTHIKWAYASMDGKHPEEFMLGNFAVRTRGNGPDAEMEKKLRLRARRPEFVKFYEGLVAKRLPLLKKAAELGHRTNKYIDIRIDGDSARVLSECEILDIVDTGGTVVRQVNVTVLRRIDGKWKIAQSAILRY